MAHAALRLRKFNRLTHQIDPYQQRVKKIAFDNKALTRDVAIHKWNWVFTKWENTRLNGGLKGARKEIETLMEALNQDDPERLVKNPRTLSPFDSSLQTKTKQ